MTMIILSCIHLKTWKPMTIETTKEQIPINRESWRIRHFIFPQSTH